ncbi:MAG: hypothetical protein J2P18_16880 [Nocardia sp.]|nr:hypothetical protein [Nocardia sp.]
MNIPERVCEYCSHTNQGSETRCGHCGAPLRAIGHVIGEAGRITTEMDAEGVLGPAALLAGRVLGGMKSVIEDGGGAQTPDGKSSDGKSQEPKGFPMWQWLAVLVGIVAMVVVAVVALYSCSDSAAPVGDIGPVSSLPGVLQTVSSCQLLPDDQGRRCTVPAGDPLLAGGITGGRELSYSVRVDPPSRIHQTISGWRAARPSVVTDGASFVAISSAQVVWYADTVTGTHLETTSFTSRAAAQTFLRRAALVG